jgi:hypothetical protein
MFFVLMTTSAAVSLKNLFTNAVSLSICVKADDFLLIAFQSRFYASFFFVQSIFCVFYIIYIYNTDSCPLCFPLCGFINRARIM